MNADFLLVVAGISAILLMTALVSKSNGLGVASVLMFVFSIFLLGAYQSAQSQEVETFAGVELKTPEDVAKLIKELQEELAKPTPKPKEE